LSVPALLLNVLLPFLYRALGITQGDNNQGRWLAVLFWVSVFLVSLVSIVTVALHMRWPMRRAPESN
jgi:hypothetical protein